MDLICDNASDNSSFYLLSCFILWSFAFLFSFRRVFYLQYYSVFSDESFSCFIFKLDNYFSLIYSWVQNLCLSLLSLDISLFNLATYLTKSYFSSLSFSTLALYYLRMASFLLHSCLQPLSDYTSSFSLLRVQIQCFSLSSSQPRAALCFSIILSFLSILSKFYLIFLQ